MRPVLSKACSKDMNVRMTMSAEFHPSNYSTVRSRVVI